MENIEKSEIIIARILANLLQNGLQEQMLQFSDLELEAEYAPFFYTCIDWLEREGIIHVGGVSRTMGGLASGHVQNPTLSAFALKALGTPMIVGQETQPLVHAVGKVSEDKKSLSQLGDLVGGILGGFTKSLSS